MPRRMAPTAARQGQVLSLGSSLGGPAHPPQSRLDYEVTMPSDMDKRSRGAPVEAVFNPFGARDPEPAPVCCDSPTEPQMVKARDESGEISFVTVWCCRRCGKKTV